MRRIDRISLWVKARLWIVVIIGLLIIVYKLPENIDQMGIESQYKNLVSVCENAGYDYYKRIDRYPSDDEENDFILECAAAAASCAWGNDTVPFYKARLWVYDCEVEHGK